MKRFFNSCRCYRRSLCLLASGELREPEKDEIENHLAACADCRKYYTEIKAVTTSLVDWERGLAHIRPSQWARNRWARAILAVETGAQTGARGPTRPADVLREWWHDVIWPCRRTWTALAALWVLILIGNVSLRDNQHAVMAKSPARAQEVIMALRDRQSILAELLADHSAPRDADRQKFFLPKPRTEYVTIFTT